MSKIILLFILIIFSLSSISTSIAQTAMDYDFNRKIKKEDLRADFELLWKALNEAHPALYKYTSKEDLTAIYNKSLNSITADMTQQQFYKLVISFISKVRCVHTRTHEVDSYIKYLLTSCKLFPFNVRYLGNKGYITKNFSEDTTVALGSEIISINNIPFQKIVDSLFQYYRSDGFIETYKIWDGFTGNTFKYHFSKFIDSSQHFSLKILGPDSKRERNIEVEGITHQDYINYNISHSTNEKYILVKKLRLNICPDSDLAIITIKSFHNGELKDSKENYYKFLKSSFTTIEKSKVNNLIIDLRDNNGGLTENALLLYSYLTQKDFDVIEYVELTGKDFSFMEDFICPKKPLTFNKRYLYRNNKGILSTKKPNVKACYDIHKPAKKNVFTKNLYVLCNGGTASASTLFNYAVLMNKRGIFIGEEEGGNIDGCTAMDQITLTLPTSKIVIDIPLNYIQRVKIPNVKLGRGLMPDYPITPTIQDIINKNDPELNFTINLIQQKK